MFVRLNLFYFIFLFGMGSPLLAQNDKVPKVATSCLSCHGEDGISPNSKWPNLAGQKKEYLKIQMEAFRSGERKNQLMTPVSMSLTDAEIEELATYFSNLERK